MMNTSEARGSASSPARRPGRGVRGAAVLEHYSVRSVNSTSNSNSNSNSNSTMQKSNNNGIDKYFVYFWGVETK